MLYRAIGIMSGSSLDGLDIAFVEFIETRGTWAYEIKAASCKPYSEEWMKNLQSAKDLSAKQYFLLHTAYGKYIGEQVNEFIEENDLHHQVQLIASHGHTIFHAPQQQTTVQMGDGAAIAATTEINVVSDLRAMDVAFGGQGAPVVPIGEKLLFADSTFCLNIGGIANISYQSPDGYIAFDICPANRVLNMLAEKEGLAYDDGGKLAASGKVITELLTKLNSLDYYKQPFPKSLDNGFGVDEIFPIIQTFKISTADALCTYTEHIAMQVGYSLQQMKYIPTGETKKMLVTGGGAFNSFLIKRIEAQLQPIQVEVFIPEAQIVNYKEAVVMALMGVLRWREEYNVLHTVTGATRSSIGGAVWIGQEA